MEDDENGEVEFDDEDIDGFIAGGSVCSTQERLRALRAEPSCGGGGCRVAPGGPLMVPGFVSRRINVRDFHDSCGSLLSAFRAEVGDFSMEDDSLVISVDDLKILTDAVLTEKALTEVLNQSHEGQNNPEDRLLVIPKSSSRTEELGDCQQGAQEAHNAQAADSGNLRVEFNFSVPPRTGKKRGRPFDRDRRGGLLMDNTDAKRKEVLARMKSERDAARENASLHSLRAKKERESLYAKAQRPLRTLKFLNSALKTPKLASKEQFEPMKEGEVLLTVEIYHNIKRSLKTQEFIVCGSQPLTALKDRIYCLTDTVAEKAGCKVPSSYFLIEDSFYNDMRLSTAKDYSLPIRQWMRDKAKAIETWKAVEGGSLPKRRWFGSTSSQKSTLPPTFLAANMADVSFMDIECRLGAQFLYCHQGDCKHTIVIRDMRLVHPEDVQNAAAYPVLRYVYKFLSRKCTICSIYRASKVTTGDKLAPDNPCFFCDACYFLLHYSSDGTIIYDDFQVHDYYHEQC